MNGAAAPLLLALWCLVCALRMSSEPSTHDSVLLALLLSPLLFTVGARSRGLERARAIALPALTAAAQTTIGAIAFAGAVWLFLGRSAPALIAVPAALALGLGLSVDDLRPEGRDGANGADGANGWHGGDAASELAARGARHGVIGALLAVVLGETLAFWLGWMRVDASWREGLLAVVVGAGIGGAGGSFLRLVAAYIPAGGLRALATIAGAGCVVVAASWAQGSAPLAALVAGLCGPAEPLEATREQNAPARGTWTAVRFLASAGILLLLARGVTPQELQAAAPGALLFWAVVVLLRTLVQAGVGGVGRLWLAPECSGRWLGAIAWTSHPGVLSAGLVLWWTSQTRSAGLPPSVRAIAIEIVLLSLGLQGGTAARALSRAARSPTTGRGLERAPVARWELLRARATALQSHLETAERLSQSGRLDEAAANAIVAAAQTGLRAIDAELDTIALEHPTIRQREAKAALQELLTAAIDRVERSAADGALDRSMADQVAATLDRERTAPSLHTLILRARGADSTGTGRDGCE